MAPLNSFRSPMARCLAGVARADITPPVGIQSRCWGAALHETAAGVHRPFTVTALALQSTADADPPLLIAAVDLGWLEQQEMEELLDAVRDAAELAPAQVLVALSHTHAGANLSMSLRDNPGGDKIRPYLDALLDGCKTATRSALQSVQPAWVTFGTGSCHLATNRDAWDAASDQFVTGFNPEAQADDAVLVARVEGEDGTTLATVVNYGCHPTTLGPTNRLLSPDYVGATREVMEDAFGAPCLFLLGACGDTGPREGFVGDVAVADRNGRQLGFAAAAAVESLLPAGVELQYAGPIISGATLGSWTRKPVDLPAASSATVLRSRTIRVELPIKQHETEAELQARHADATRALEEATAAADAVAIRNATALRERARRALLRAPTLPNGGSVPFDIWLAQIGEAFLVGIPAEPYSVLQSELRGRFPDRSIIVSVVTNGTIAYLLPADAYGQGLYQEWVSFPGPGGLELVLEATAGGIAAWAAG